MAKALVMSTKIISVIDASGSMATMQKETVTGFNHFLNDLKKEGDPQDTVTVLLFNGRVSVLRDSVPIGDVELMRDVEYTPSGFTALYDAIGEGIARATQGAFSLKEDRYLMLIITDGEENASQLFTSAELKERIAALEESGKWEFVYMGASKRDVLKQRSSLGFGDNKSVDYCISADLAKGGQVFKSMSSVANNYRSGGTVASTDPAWRANLSSTGKKD